MSIRRTFFGIVVLATSSVLFAQTTETKPPDVGSSGDASSRSGSALVSPCRSGAHQAEILTDTMGGGLWALSDADHPNRAPELV